MVNDIVNGLIDFVGSIGSGILDFIISIIGFIINLVLLPIDALIIAIFPNLSEQLVHFNNGLSNLATAPIGFIMYHIPPVTRNVIIIYIGILISYYSIIWTYRAIIVIPRVINKIKFW